MVFHARKHSCKLNQGIHDHEIRGLLARASQRLIHPDPSHNHRTHMKWLQATNH